MKMNSLVNEVRGKAIAYWGKGTKYLKQFTDSGLAVRGQEIRELIPKLQKGMV